MPHDPFDLDRFVRAQAPAFDAALAELRAGRKRSHWMWFVFPQLRGLGVSPTAALYGLASIDEARAYVAHRMLGPRLFESFEAALTHADRDLTAIFGSPDDLKFRSSATLFDRAAPDIPVFRRALREFCGGEPDQRTIALLDGATPSR